MSSTKDKIRHRNIELQELSNEEQISKSNTIELIPAQQVPITGKQIIPDFDYDSDDFEYPEGGKKAWTVVFGCFLGLIACFGLLNTTGIIETYLENHQLHNEKSSTIGWVFSLMNFICCASCIFSGTYFDRNGFKVPVIIGTILQVVGLSGTANSTKLWHFILSFSTICGFGNGILISPLVSAPAHYFKRKRGTATALATVGGSVGGGIFPLMLKKFFELKSSNNPYYGFMWGIRSLAFINLTLLILSISLANERISFIDTNDRKINEPQWKYVTRIYILESFDMKAFKDLRYSFCVFGTSLGELSLICVVTYYGSYVMSQGLSQSDAYMLIMVINLTGILGRWIPGRLSDSFGRFNVAISTLAMLSAVMFIGWYPFGTNLQNLYVISASYGFFSGSILSLLPVCCSQISKTEEFGRRYSTMYFCVGIVMLIGVPITGAIIGTKSYTDYQNYKIFCGVTTIASALCFAISHYFAVGLKLIKF